MGQKHKRFRKFRTPFPLRDIRVNPRSNVRACAEGDGAICCKNRKIVPYHGANPILEMARLRSPSLIMAPDCIVWYGMVWYGLAWYGMVWYGMVWYGMTLYCIVGVWKGIFGIRDFTKIRCGNRGNDKYLDGIRD